MNELNKCPFCGKNVAECYTIAEAMLTDHNSVDYNYDLTHYTIICNYNNGGCGASIGQWHKSKADAIEAWNKRMA